MTKFSFVLPVRKARFLPSAMAGTLHPEDFPTLRQSSYLFARKFAR